MSEFEEWFSSEWVKLKSDTPIGETLGARRNCQSTWEYKQKEIDELKANLKEMIGTMKNNHAYHGDDNSWKCDDEDCVGCLYERRYLKDKENE